MLPWFYYRPSDRVLRRNIGAGFLSGPHGGPVPAITKKDVADLAWIVPAVLQLLNMPRRRD